MSKFSPMAGLTFRSTPLQSFYLNYSTAFQTPTTTELSNHPTGASGFNPDLKPERVRNLEFGMKGTLSKSKLNYDLAFFRMTLDDMLIPFQTQAVGSEEIFFRNAGKTRNIGLEAKLEWLPMNHLRATFSYAFMNFEFADFVVEISDGNLGSRYQLAGKKVPGIPKHRFFAGIDYEHSSGVYAAVEAQQVGEYFANDFNGPEPGTNTLVEDFINPSFIKTDVRLGLRSSIKDYGVDFFLGLNNLFDEHYNGSIVPNAFANRFFEPAPGRVWYAGLEFSVQ